MMRKPTYLALIAVGGASSLLVAACGSSSSPAANSGTTTTSTTAAAAAAYTCDPGATPPPASGGTVSIAWGGGAVQTGFTSKVAPAIQAATGLTVSYSGGSSATQMSQVVAQGGTSDWDLLFGSIPSYNLGVQNKVIDQLNMGLLSKEASVSASRLDAGDGRGVALNTTSYGIAYVPATLAKKGAPVPTKYEDLWNPAYKGMIGLYAPPYSSGLQGIAIVNKLQGGSPSDMTPGITKLAQIARGATLASSLSDMSTAVGNGSVGTWIETSGAANAMVAQGLKVQMVFPPNETYGIDIVATIPSGAKNKGAACVALGYLLSAPGQAVLAGIVGNKPVRSDVPAPANALAPSSVQPINPLLTGAPADTAITQQWNQAIH